MPKRVYKQQALQRAVPQPTTAQPHRFLSTQAPIDSGLQRAVIDQSRLAPRDVMTLQRTVESGAKQFKARFSGPGMRWSRTGAENLLPIRSAVLSGSFDHMWAGAKNLPQL